MTQDSFNPKSKTMKLDPLIGSLYHIERIIIFVSGALVGAIAYAVVHFGYGH